MRGDEMRGVKGYAAMYLLWMAFTLCLGYGLVQADYTAKLHRGTVVALDGGADWETGERMSSMENEEDAPVDFALWREAPGEILAEDGGYSRLPASVTECFGNTELACQDGSAPELLFGDEGGCLLSADLARQLFGSENVVGQTLFCGNRQRVIRGILRRGRGRIVVQAGEDFAGTMDRLTIGDTGSQADDFLLRHGLSGKKLSLEYAALAAKLAAWGLLLFVGLYPLYGVRGLSRGCPAVLRARAEDGCFAPESQKKEPPAVMDEERIVPYPRVRILIRRLGILAAAFLYLYVLIFAMDWGGSFSVHELLPTKWSDFAFWSRKGQEIAASVGFLFGCEKTEREQAVLWAAAVGIFFLFLAFWLYWGVARRLAGISVYTLTTLIILHWAGLAALSVRCGEISGVWAAHRGLWLAAPLGISFLFFTR